MNKWLWCCEFIPFWWDFCVLTAGLVPRSRDPFAPWRERGWIRSILVKCNCTSIKCSIWAVFKTLWKYVRVSWSLSYRWNTVKNDTVFFNDYLKSNQTTLTEVNTSMNWSDLVHRSLSFSFRALVRQFGAEKDCDVNVRCISSWGTVRPVTTKISKGQVTHRWWRCTLGRRQPRRCSRSPSSATTSPISPSAVPPSMMTTSWYFPPTRSSGYHLTVNCHFGCWCRTRSSYRWGTSSCITWTSTATRSGQCPSSALISPSRRRLLRSSSMKHSTSALGSTEVTTIVAIWRRLHQNLNWERLTELNWIKQLNYIK